MRISGMLKKLLRKEKDKGKVENVLVQLMKHHISTFHTVIFYGRDQSDGYSRKSR